MKKMDRRDFLRNSTLGLAGIGLTPYFFSSAQPLRAEAPSDRLRMGCIGVGDMGRWDARMFNPLVDIAAVCDVDTLHLDMASEDSDIGRKDASGNKVKPDRYKDYRPILDRDDIDVVSIVTPDHWHTKIAIEALQAGKHVFCQKPLTLTIEENRLIRAACKKYNRVFQVGTQQRSQRDQFLLAILMVRKGMLGEIKKMTCNIEASPVSSVIPKKAVPETLDFERWLGQAPLTDYLGSDELFHPERPNSCPKYSRVHYEFRWWYEYSGGKFTDWGAHHIDIAMWALDQLGPGRGPTKINPILAEHPVPFKNGMPTENNRYNTSHKFRIECLFDDGVILEAVSHSADGRGILIEGTKGKIHVNRERIKGKPYEMIGGELDEHGHSKPWDQLPELQKHFSEDDFVQLYNGKRFTYNHKKNFIDCIRTGGLPVSDVFTHVQAMNVCHLCAIAARLGREIRWNPKTEQTRDEQSMSFLSREQRKGYEIPQDF